MNERIPALAEIVTSRSIPEPNSGCWLWEKSANKVGGYGVTWFSGHKMRAHRASFLAFVGEIPGGLHVCHRCDNPLCVNPDHLFLGDRFDNLRDAATKGRLWTQKVTHCPRGHEFDAKKKTARGTYQRVCTECRRLLDRERSRRRKDGR